LSEVRSIADFYQTISLTGGEPLLQVDFLESLLPKLRDLNKQIFLETNGTNHLALGKIIDYVDIVSMDFKLPSSTESEDFFREHELFLRIAFRKKVYVKVVVALNTSSEDIERTVDIISAIDSNIPLVLQPEFSDEEKIKDKLDLFYKMSLKKLKRVKVISQLHKKLGIR